MPVLALTVLPQTLAICRLEASAAIPSWAMSEQFGSITRSADELSVVCSESAVPHDVRCERGWRAVRVQGTLDFALVGVLASLIVPLAAAGISVFAISTFDTDYVLIREADLTGALAALRAAGRELA